MMKQVLYQNLSHDQSQHSDIIIRVYLLYNNLILYFLRKYIDNINGGIHKKMNGKKIIMLTIENTK